LPNKHSDKTKDRANKKVFRQFLTMDKAKTNIKKALVQLSQKESKVPVLGLHGCSANKLPFFQTK
jgi:phage replication-related protein YjqB (UPF0714/DUF867 family)